MPVVVDPHDAAVHAHGSEPASVNHVDGGHHGAAHVEHSHNPLSPEHLFGHVQDAPYFEVPRALDFDGNVDEGFRGKADGHVHIPQIRDTSKPLWESRTGVRQIDDFIGPLDLQITKFMVIEAAIGVLMVAIFSLLAMRMRGGGAPRGRVWNAFEMVLVYIRDEIARPNIGHHDGDKYLPFLWTLFFFVLFGNLFGLLPYMGSPTGSLAVTGGLALMTFIVVVGSGMMKLGPLGYVTSQAPHMDLPGPLALIIKPAIIGLELLSLCIKHFVLAVRLLANMFAGHLVLAVLLAFIAVTAESVLFWGVMPASVLGSVALMLLELFVAFLQAYIFTFLAALFIGSAVHPH